MTCRESCVALLEALETRTRLVNELRAARVDATWREALLAQADLERQAAFDCWRDHLAQPMDLTVERLGEHATLQYGPIWRVLPISTLGTRRGAQLIAETLWDAAHPRPDSEQYAEAWREARPFAIHALLDDISTRVANLE